MMIRLANGTTVHDEAEVGDAEVVSVQISEFIMNPNSFRTEGVYRLKGAELTTRYLMMGSGKGAHQEQKWMVSGPTVAAVRELYSLVRQGKLAPFENWEAPESWRGPSPAERESLEVRLAVLEEVVRILLRKIDELQSSVEEICSDEPDPASPVWGSAGLSAPDPVVDPSVDPPAPAAEESAPPDGAPTDN